MKAWAAATALLVTEGAAIARTPPESAILLDRFGVELREFSPPGGRQMAVSLEEVSPWLPLALVAAEDGRFFVHPGVDLRAVARAAWQNVSSGRRRSGASTISMQVARALRPAPRTMNSKVREARAALELERSLGKQIILERYLNLAAFGADAIGAEAGARRIFGVRARDLSLAQAALLAGVPRSPDAGDPLRHPEKAKRREREVLRRMVALGWLTKAEAAVASSERLDYRSRRRLKLAPHFSEFVRARVAGDRVVRTTLDGGLQAAAEAAVRMHLADLSGEGVTNAAVVVLSGPRNEILAWVGSADYWNDGIAGRVDAVRARRQPGSVVKPFVYALALERGWTPASILDDTRYWTREGWRPRNYDQEYHGPIRLREALACSYNVPAVRLAESLGADVVAQGLRDAGLGGALDDPGRHGIGASLGTGETTLLDLACAYAAIARGGFLLPPSCFAGEAAAASPDRCRSIMREETAAILADILGDNHARARAFGLNSALHLPFPFAAKTGTTKDYRDNWAVGFTPGWTVAVWVGNADGAPMRRVSGITGAGPILRDVARATEARLGSTPFRQPSGTIRIETCLESGDAAGRACVSRAAELVTSRNGLISRCRLHAVGLSASGADGQEASRLAISFPRNGEVFKMDPDAPSSSQVIRLRCAAPHAAGPVAWSVNGRRLETIGTEAWWQLEPGWHDVLVTIPGGAQPVTAGPNRFYVER